METKVNPGAGYRLLEPGEIIEPDDELLGFNTWIRTSHPGHAVGSGVCKHIYRRKIGPASAGLKPRHVARAERLHDVRTAIRRSVEAKQDVPHEWLAEYLELAHDDFMMTL